MISEAYLWIWLPGASEPVVYGKLQRDNDVYSFVYGRSYLEKGNAIALEPRDLPLEEGVFTPMLGETHSVIRDAAPDAWGRRVLMYRSGGRNLTELDYLLRAGSDRIGALDVRLEPTDCAVTRQIVQHTKKERIITKTRKMIRFSRRFTQMNTDGLNTKKHLMLFSVYSESSARDQRFPELRLGNASFICLKICLL